jgi:hypothetical protein
VRRFALAWLGVLALLASAPAGAEIVRAEGEGSAPITGVAAPSPRAAALKAALADAVRAVAERLAGTASGPAAEEALRAALGPDPARFAQSYRDLGQSERPGPEGRELIVRVEARVDAGSVAEALRRAGLLAERASPPMAGSGSRLVVEPLPPWPLLSAVRKRLVELGARRVSPERAEPSGVVLSIESDRSAGGLVEALIASPPPGVSVVPIGDRDGAPAIRLEALPASLRAD